MYHGTSTSLCDPPSFPVRPAGPGTMLQDGPGGAACPDSDRIGSIKYYKGLTVTEVESGGSVKDFLQNRVRPPVQVKSRVDRSNSKVVVLYRASFNCTFGSKSNRYRKCVKVQVLYEERFSLLCKLQACRRKGLAQHALGPGRRTVLR